MNRFEAIDLLRGLIMIFMALDHASAMVARVHFGEMWGVDFKAYPDLAWWFTRFISHLCAPGFFFLMGMSIYLFAQKRKASNWEDRKIRNYFLKRGAIILFLMFFLEFPAWGLGMSFSQLAPEETIMPGDYEGGFLLPTTVLYGLGMCMIISSLLWKLKNWQWLLITIISFGFSGYFIANTEPLQAFNPLEHFLFVPGMSKGAMVIYPVIPWLGITTLGMFFGQLMKKKPSGFTKITLLAGLLFLAIFLGLRFLELGNFQKSSYQDWISFFTFIKYPPSIIFALFTCGANLLILSLFSMLKADTKWLKPIRIFGQTAMFYYIAHLYIFAIMGILFPMGSGIEIMYLMWGLALIILYFICDKFLQFKKGKPLDSLWRMI